MPKLISCPTCSAPLDPGADNAFRVRCSYCGNVLSVDARDDDPEPFAGFADVAPRIAEIVRLARSGQKIHAIKLYRETFGVGLAEAKDAVERLEVGRPVTFGHTTVQTGSLSRTSFGGGAAPGWQQTEPAKPAKSGAGCGIAGAVLGVVVALVAAGAVAFLILARKPAALPTPPVAPVPAKPVSGSGTAGPVAPGPGAPALVFGSEGIGAGQFKDARSVAVDGQGRIFQVKHSYINGWHLPGGGVETGETLLTALTRELMEEGNIRLTAEPKLHGVFFNVRVSRRDHVALYVVREFVQDAPPTPDREIIAHGFFAPDALPPDTGRATRARIAEVLNGVPVSELW